MSGYIPEAEYQAIKASWRTALKNPERWTNGQMVTACLTNIDEAAKREARLRREYDRLPPGDPRLLGDKETPSMREQIRTAASDQTHWRGEVAFWRGRCAAEGDSTMPPTSFKVDREKQPDWTADPKFSRDPVIAAERDTRLPREPGDDDVEDAL